MNSSKRLLSSALIAAALCALSSAEDAPSFDCSAFDQVESFSDGALGQVKDYFEKHGEASTFGLECLSSAVKRNYIDAASFMVENYYSKD